MNFKARYLQSVGTYSVQHNNEFTIGEATVRDIPHVVYIKYYVATTSGGCPSQSDIFSHVL